MDQSRGKQAEQNVKFQARGISYAVERREKRYTVSIPVTVFGFNANGRVFQELASCRNVSRSGVRIHMHTQPERSTPIALRVVPREGPIQDEIPHLSYQIAWMLPANEGWDIGAISLDDGDLLLLAFPPHRP